MPSSKKTPNLLLNRWLGGDKPKKDDFIEDNDIVDQAVADLRQKLLESGSRTLEQLQTLRGQMEEEIAGVQNKWSTLLVALSGDWSAALSEAGASWDKSLSEAKTDLSDGISAATGSLNAHKADGAIHVTQAQKDGWSSHGVTTGSFTGDGANTQKIVTGWKPRAGIVFAAGTPPVKSNWNTNTGEVYTAFLAAGVAGAAVQIDADGFTAMNVQTNSDGYAFRLNESGRVYAYMMWQ